MKQFHDLLPSINPYQQNIVVVYHDEIPKTAFNDSIFAKLSKVESLTTNLAVIFRLDLSRLLYSFRDRLFTQFHPIIF